MHEAAGVRICQRSCQLLHMRLLGGLACGAENSVRPLDYCPSQRSPAANVRGSFRVGSRAAAPGARAACDADSSHAQILHGASAEAVAQCGIAGGGSVCMHANMRRLVSPVAVQLAAACVFPVLLTSAGSRLWSQSGSV